jgi:hypothetical protein
MSEKHVLNLQRTWENPGSKWSVIKQIADQWVPWSYRETVKSKLWQRLDHSDNHFPSLDFFGLPSRDASGARISSIPINNKGGKISVVNHFFWSNLPSHQIIYYHQCHS